MPAQFCRQRSTFLETPYNGTVPRTRSGLRFLFIGIPVVRRESPATSGVLPPTSFMGLKEVNLIGNPKSNHLGRVATHLMTGKTGLHCLVPKVMTITNEASPCFVFPAGLA